MATLNRIRKMLNEQRRTLLDQLDAVDRAIAALDSAGIAAADVAPAQPGVTTDKTAMPVVPRRVTPKRVLSDSHKEALVRGGRKAREAKAAAKGLAREMPDDGFVPAIGTRGEGQPPRLVRRPAKS